jgi:hypothetical protein
MASNRPVMFIGSSKEGLPAAKALQVNLDDPADVVCGAKASLDCLRGRSKV